MTKGASSAAYPEPVRALLLVGEDQSEDEAQWQDYAARFGLTEADTDSLIRLACDPALHNEAADSIEAWAPTHAWRALAQLQAGAAVPPLLALLEWLNDDDDIAAEEDLPIVFGIIGAPAIPHIAAFLADRSKPTFAAADAVTGLAEIAKRHPECRAECVEILTRVLEPHADSDSIVNGYAVGSLLGMAAVEAIDAIRAAFHSGVVEPSISGDLEDVEVEFGLRKKRTTRPAYSTIDDDGPVLDRDYDADFDPGYDADRVVPVTPRSEKIGRNDFCPCGSGKKYKKCCLV